MTMLSPEAPPDMASPLGASVRALGSSIHVRQDSGSTWLVMLCGALVAVIGLVLVFGHFARTESVRGYASATSGMSRLDAQVNGIVKKILVPQGGLVKAGQPILTVQLREITSKGVSTVSAAAQSLRLKAVNLTADRARLAGFLAESTVDATRMSEITRTLVKAFDQNERDIKQALDRQQDMVTKVRQYMTAGYATRDALNAYERTAFDYQRQLSDVGLRRAELMQQNTDRLRARQQLVLEKQAQVSTIDSDLALIAAQLTTTGAQSQIDILAPVDGQVASMLTEVGASVQADQVVAVVGDPGAEPIVVLEVPSRAIGLAKIGQRVVLKYDAFPFKTFGVSYGTISAISSSPMKAPSVASDKDGLTDPRPAAVAAMAGQSVYRVEVKPDSRTIQAYGHDETIAPGSTLAADIVIERRRLIDWVLDPIRAMRGRG